MKVTTFNNATRKATFENVSAKSGKREFSVPAFTQDALSAIYVMRALPLKVGAKETIPVTTGGRSYRAQVTVVGTEALENRGGTLSDIPAADDCSTTKPASRAAARFNSGSATRPLACR